MMRLVLVRVAVVLVFGVVAVAQAISQQADERPRAVHPGVGRDNAAAKRSAASALLVDTQASQVYVKVGAEGYGHEHAVLGRFVRGKIVPGGAGELVFDMKSFAVDAPEARRALGMARQVSAADQQKVTTTMLGRDVLDATHHPQAVFTISATTPNEGQATGDPGRYRLEGQLALRGVTRPLRLVATLAPGDNAGVWRLSGSFSIMQTQFGITPYRALAGLVRVADKLEIWGELVLEPQGP